MNWLILTLLSALFMGFAGIFQKHLLKKEHSLNLIIMLYLFGFLFLIPFNIYSAPNFEIIPYHLVFLRALVVSLGMYFFAKGLHHTDISLMAPLRNASPMFLVIISFFILGETLSFKEYLGIGVLIVGTYFLTMDHDETVFEHMKRMFSSKHIIYGFIAIILMSFAPPIEKIIFSNYSIQIHNYLFVNYFFATIILFSIYLAHKYPVNELFESIKTKYKYMAMFSFLDLTSIYFVVSAIAIPGALVSLIIPIRRFSTTIEMVIGGKLFKEARLVHRTTAGLIMLFGAVIILI